MKKSELIFKIKSIYDWTLSDEKIWRVYNAFLDLVLNENRETLEYLYRLTTFDKTQRLDFRNKLSEKGFELRPDELNQYILLIMIAINESEVING